MSLEMKDVCGKCGARLSPEGLAYICSHECTFCAACALGLEGTCPNCGGELARRPTRKAEAAPACAADSAPAAARPRP